MQYIRKSSSRGQVNLGWLQSQHSFSFGHYYDSAHMGVSVLRVINDDVVAPGQGFGTHGHQDMEIISYVIDGALEHKDSMGNVHVVPAGDVQRMSAGTGVTHSEYNHSAKAPVNFLQIWIKPKSLGIKPSYQQQTIKPRGALTPLVTPNGIDGSLSMHQDASIYQLQLAVGEQFELQTGERLGYLHLVSGSIAIDGQVFVSGDGFAVDDNEQVVVKATQPFKALWFDLPLHG